MMNLAQKTERLRRIFRGEETYSTGIPSQQANDYFAKEMMDEVLGSAREHNQPAEDIDLLVSLAGFSPITTILTYHILRPRRLVVVHSTSARESLNVIGAALIGEGKLAFADYSTTACDPTNPVDIYRIVKSELSLGEAAPNRTMIDITGGKKVMSAAAALAAWQLDLRLCYVDSEYDPELRRATPGSERLLVLDNPSTLFGDSEMASAIAIFDSGQFSAAQATFATLAERLASPAKARFMRDLSTMYSAWADLDFERAQQAAQALAPALTSKIVPVDETTRRRLQNQVEFIAELRPENQQALLLTFFLLGDHYLNQGRHDFATLLFYRTVEGCLTARLDSQYRLSANSPDYEVLGVDQKDLTARYDALAGEVFSKRERSGLPPQLGFMTAALMLHLLDDQLLTELHIDDAKQLKWLQGISSTRNRSVLAHGFDVIGLEETEELQHLAMRVLSAHHMLAGASLEDQIDTLRFVRAKYVVDQSPART